MKTGIVNSKNIKDVKKLWSYCFSDTPEFIEYYFDKRYERERNIITEDEQGKIQASLQLHPYTMIVNNVCKNVNYVVGVCVQPESRGRGYSSTIMKDTLNFQYMNDEDVSILMPIDTEIYTRYGYTNCFYRYEFNVDLANIRAEKTKAATKRVDIDCLIKKDGDDNQNKKSVIQTVAQMSDFYHNNIVDKYSYIKRDEQYFIHKLEELSVDGGELFVTYEGSLLSGYMMILPRHAPGHAVVTEMMFGNKDSFYCLMSIIKSHITQFQTVDIITPQHELFNLFIKYDNKYKMTKKSFMMVRVINAKNIIKEIINRHPKIHEMGEFEFEIKDSVIKDNNFKEKFGFKETDDKLNSAKEGDIPLISMDIADLASLYMKSSNTSDLYRAGRILFKNDSEREFFEQLLGPDIRENYINDFI